MTFTCATEHRQVAGEQWQNDPAPECKGVIATRERLESEDSPVASAG